VRFTLTAMSGQARDIRLSRQRIEGYRNFGTKLWNAARFCEVNECRRVDGFDPGAVEQTLNRWIRGEAVRAAAEVTKALAECAFSDAASAIYRFVWNVVCDQYVELAKPILNGEDAAAKAETRATAAWTLQICLKLLHPISPFITETLWGEFGEPAEGLLITAPWPDLPEAWIDAAADAEMAWVNGLIDEVRSIRAETNVPPQARVPLVLVGADALTRERLVANGALIERMTRLSSLGPADSAPAGAVQFVIGQTTGALAIADVIDVAAERTRLAKEIAARAADVERTAKKLASPDFVARAPEEVVEENRERLAEAESAKTRLQGALERLAGVS
jgi:valyl-tRNA synthetase